MRKERYYFSTEKDDGDNDDDDGEEDGDDDDDDDNDDDDDDDDVKKYGRDWSDKGGGSPCGRQDCTVVVKMMMIVSPVEVEIIIMATEEIRICSDGVRLALGLLIFFFCFVLFIFRGWTNKNWCIHCITGDHNMDQLLRW